VLTIVVASTVATYVVSSKQPARFRSSTQVFISNSQIEAVLGGAPAGGNDRASLDQAKLLLSRPVSVQVINRLGLHEGPDTLQSTVTAVPISGSNFVTVTAERGSGAEAAAVANAYAQEYFRVRKDQVNKEAAATISRLRAQIASIPPGPRNDLQRAALQVTVSQVRATEEATPRDAQQTNPPATGAQFAPTPKRNAIFAFAISLGLGLALALALTRFDRRIRKLDEVADLYGMPMLSVIPHGATTAKDHGGKATVPVAMREPFRSLRTNLQLASLDKPIKCIVVASAVSGEGKSTIVRNLALTYREWGQSVVILEADLRRPTLSASFGVKSDGGGVTGVLTGDCKLEDALLDIEIDVESLGYLDKVRDPDQRLGGGTAQTTSGKLTLLPSGSTPPNPQAVLAADTMRRLIGQLSSQFDIVLIDTPPLLAVSDAIPLLPQADGVVLVTRVGVTERPAVRRAVTAARLVPNVNILGVVANDLDYQPGSGYGYGYGYGQPYGAATSNGKKTAR
jgi:Mrp family chromosome partitioning ATPase/capsular polysaccharide biosynthesis protein